MIEQLLAGLLHHPIGTLEQRFETPLGRWCW